MIPNMAAQYALGRPPAISGAMPPTQPMQPMPVRGTAMPAAPAAPAMPVRGTAMPASPGYTVQNSPVMQPQTRPVMQPGQMAPVGTPGPANLMQNPNVRNFLMQRAGLSL